MNTLKNILSFATIIIVALSTMIYFTGCEKFNSPLEPGKEINKEQFIETSTGQQLQVLTFGELKPALKKGRRISKFIERDKGGTLKLKFKVEKIDGGKIEVDVKLRVHKNSIQQDSELLMSLDDEQFFADLDVLFGPHGIQFSEPADLDIKIDLKDTNLEGINPDEVSVYYDNDGKGWEKMDCKEIKIKVDENGIKKIEVKKGKLPHFSRYALCKG
jgi:hypothetical protein